MEKKNLEMETSRTKRALEIVDHQTQLRSDHTTEVHMA